MEKVPPKTAFRKFLVHAPWWVISVSIGALTLGVMSLVHFQEQKRKEVSFVLSAPRELTPPPPIETPNPEEFIKPEAIPMPDRLEEVDPTKDPVPLMPADFLISDMARSMGGEEDDTVKGDPSKTDFGPTDGSPFDVIGPGRGSGLVKGGGWGNGPGSHEKTRPPYTGAPPTRIKDVPFQQTLDGLLWLARHQATDGSWKPEAFPDRCKGNPCNGGGYESFTVGSTGLALLAFLGAGFDQFNRTRVFDKFLEKEVSFDGNIKRGVQWLIEHQSEDGAFGPVSGLFFYNHAIATMALCETYGMRHTDLAKQSALKGIEFLVRHQSTDPGGTGLLGWKYLPGSNLSDTSVTGWCVMALKSAELSGLGHFTGAYDGAMNFVRQATAPNGLVGYLGRDDAGQKTHIEGVNEEYDNHPAMTAVGMCVRAFTQKDLSDPMLAAGAKALVQDLPAWSENKKSVDYYYWYYGSLALNQYDGPESPRNDGSLWKKWNQAMVKVLVERQHKMGSGCLVGSWDGDDRWGHAAGRLYATALNTLTLEVYYRYPNAFVGKARESDVQAVKKAPK